MAENCFGAECAQLPPEMNPCHLTGDMIVPANVNWDDTTQNYNIIYGPGWDGHISNNLGTISLCNDFRLEGAALSYLRCWVIGKRTVVVSSSAGNADYFPVKSLQSRDEDATHFGLYAAAQSYKFRIYDPDSIYWNSLYQEWRQDEMEFEMNAIYVPVSDPTGLCPIGTEFNPLTGGCDQLPDWEWDPSGGSGGEGAYVLSYPLPEFPGGVPGLTHPPTYPPNESGICPPGYALDTVQNICVYDGSDGVPAPNCIPIGGCEIPLSVVLEPIDLDKILPPGYLESGGLPLQPTGEPINSILEPIEPTFDPNTGECIILDDCD